jgi:membrane protein DedA with SNARE-associated domain
MTLPKFLLYTAAGSAIWTAALAFAGQKLGERYDVVERYLGPATYVVLGGLAIWAVIAVIRRRRRTKRGAEEGLEPASGADPAR